VTRSIATPASPVLIMAAPNGARRTHADHPGLPISEDEIVEAAAACFEAGAGALHAHARDANARHLLDAAAYRRLLARLAERTPGMAVQVTTEAAGRYEPAEQAALLDALKPRFASVAVRELFAAGEAFASQVVKRAENAGVALQYILYDDQDLAWLRALSDRQALSSPPHRIILVFGRYTVNQDSDVSELHARLATLRSLGLERETIWMACAFGRGETAVLEAAMAEGGHARVGFENSLLHADGRVAASNQERVSVIAGIARKLGRPLASAAEAAAVLGARPPITRDA
jgi:3-keto-5-aminohexanoate cleavage enzyme